MLTSVILACLISLLGTRCVASCSFLDSKQQHWAIARLKKFGKNPCATLSGGIHNETDIVPKVKVFLFQKDEDEVLSDWLQYYSYMFGAGNLVVIDHESQSQSVCRLLELYKLCGAEVLTHRGTFDTKHAVLTREMRKHNGTFLLPLDADEFVVSGGPNDPLRIQRAKLLQAFRDLPTDGRKYKFAHSYCARPTPANCLLAANSSSAHDGHHEYNRRIDLSEVATDERAFFPRSKTFYHSNGFISTDQGNHYGEVKHDKGVTNTAPAIEKNVTHYFAPLNAAILHYSVSSYRAIENKYLRGFAAYNFTMDSDCGTVQGGQSYCIHGKEFLSDINKSRNFYLYLCSSKDKGKPLFGVSNWFSKHALPLPQIVA